MRYKRSRYLAVSMRSMGCRALLRRNAADPVPRKKRGAEANFDPSVTEPAYDYLRMRANWAA